MMKNKFFNIVDHLSIILMLLTLLVVICGLVLVPITGSRRYYAKEFEKNDTINHISYTYKDTDGTYKKMEYTKEDLDVIIGSIIDYLLHNKESMQVVLTKDGTDYEVFSNQALNHMADVKVIYKKGITLVWICAVLAIMSIAWFIYRIRYSSFKMFKTSLITIIVVGSIFLALGIYILADWDNAFINFHHVIFPSIEKFNDAFFDYKSNYPEKYYINNLTLINVLSESIFMDAGLICVGSVLLYLVCYFILSWFVSKRLIFKLK